VSQNTDMPTSGSLSLKKQAGYSQTYLGKSGVRNTIGGALKSQG